MRFFTESPTKPEQAPAFGEEYVRRLAEGDHEIEDHFTTCFGELLTVKLRGRVRSREMAEDVRQETFERVLEVVHNGGLEHPERLGAFVNAVCNNVLFEKFRQEARHCPLEESSEERPDRRVDLDAALVDQERRKLVKSVLAKLPRRDQDLLRMLFFEEIDKAEACERLAVSPEYLRVLLHRAKGLFRKKLAERRAGPERSVWRNPQDIVKRSRYAVHYKVRYSDGT